MWRAVNALCYLISGIVLIVLAHSSVGAVLVGIGMVAYGLYVGLTRRSYWVSTYTYVIPIIGIAVAVAAANH